VTAFDRGDRGRQHTVELEYIHGPVDGLERRVKDTIEIRLLGVPIDPAVTFFESLARDLKIFDELFAFKPLRGRLAALSKRKHCKRKGEHKSQY
jgi:hypothetical protein